MTAVLFAIAAALGGLVRWRLAGWNRSLPWGTLLVNDAASFAAGLVVGSSANVVLVVGTAGLGSLSTFSTVTAELVDLHEHTSTRLAVAYLALMLILGVGAAAVGLVLGDYL